MKKMKCLLPVLINQYNNKIFVTGGERLTQASLAEQTGIAASTISRLFNGSAQRYDATTVERLCEFFDCQVGDLLALVDVPEESQPIKPMDWIGNV